MVKSKIYSGELSLHELVSMVALHALLGNANPARLLRCTAFAVRCTVPEPASRTFIAVSAVEACQMKGRYVILIAVVLVAIGAFVGWYFARPVPVVEKPAPEVKQDDGSVIVERAPDAKAKPKHKIPNGAKVERTASVTVQGEGLKMPGGEIKPCPPV